MICNKQTFYNSYTDEELNYIQTYGSRYGDDWVKEFLLTDEGKKHMFDLLQANSIDDTFGYIYKEVILSHYKAMKEYEENKVKEIYKKIGYSIIE